MRVLGLPEVIYPVGLFGIDIGMEGLCNRLDGAFCATICLLVKGGRWHKVNIESFMEFSKDRKSTRLNSSHSTLSRMPSSA